MAVSNVQKEMLKNLAIGLSKPPRTPILRTPKDVGLAFEPIFFKTSDNVKISGWYMPSKNSNKIIISNHFSPGNKYGFAGHLEGLQFAGGFEVNFLPRYKALVDAGYHVLAYDLRCHGDSGEAENGLSGVGYWEHEEVEASMRYVINRFPTMDINLYVMCMGSNATYNAMYKNPSLFKNVKSMISVAGLKGKTSIQRNLEKMQIAEEEGLKAFEEIYSGLTGLKIEDHNVLKKADVVEIPTFFVQVRDDDSSNWKDVQYLYDNASTDDKKVFYIEGTPLRFRGYQYFSDHPEQMIEWYNNHNSA